MCIRRAVAALALAVTLGLPSTALIAEERPESEFVLRVPDRQGRGHVEHAVDVGRPVRVRGARGAQLRIVLRRPDQTYVGHGIRFAYPGGLAVAPEEFPGGVLIRVQEGEDYRLDLTLVAADVATPAQAHDGMIAVTKDWLEARGIVVGPVKKCRHVIAGEERVGSRVQTEGEEDVTVVDLYAFTLGERTVAINLRRRESTRTPAKEAFQKIAESLALVGSDEEAPQGKGGTEFEIEVGERRIPVVLEKPFELVSAGGAKIRATLRRASVVYTDHGIRFEYPTGMTSRTVVSPGRVRITVERGKDFHAGLQLLQLPDATPAKALEITAATVKRSVERTGARFATDTTCRAEIGARVRQGVRMTTLDETDPELIDIYAFEFADRILLALYFHKESNREAALQAFGRISGSLREE